MCQTNLSKHWMFLTNTGFKYSDGNFQFLRFFSNRWKKTPKTLLKAYLTSQTITGLFLNCLMIQYNSKKNLLIAEYLLLLMQLRFYVRKKLEIRHAVLDTFSLVAVRKNFAISKNQEMSLSL